MAIKVIAVPVFWLIAEYGLSLLVQTGILSGDWTGVLEQLPFVGILIWLWYVSNRRDTEQEERSQKHLEYMLEIQRNFFRDTIDAQNVRVNQMADRIELLTQQLAINTSTVNEVSKVDDVLDLLIKRLAPPGRSDG